VRVKHKTKSQSTLNKGKETKKAKINISPAMNLFYSVSAKNSLTKINNIKNNKHKKK
jgi:hypothetical protein